jgi:hypothetical protein
LLSRVIEITGGIATALLGLYIYLYMALKDASLGTSVEHTTDVLGILMLVVPGILVAMGSYLHVVLRRNWALALVFVGGVCNLIFVGLNAGFAFAYGRDLWGQWAVLVDLVVVIFTLATAFINGLVLWFPVMNWNEKPVDTTR